MVGRSKSINVGAIIDAAPLSRFHYELIALCGFIAMLDGFDTQCIAFVAPVLAKEWGVSSGLFGPVFAAGLMGIMLGQLVFGPLSDRLGRRPVIIACILLFGTLTLCTALVDELELLLVLRFLAGIGLGGATPNIIALVSEYAPARARATMITVMFGGFPLGAAVGGFLSSMLIPAFGWQAVFYMGGVVPLLFLAIVVWRLPESVCHMVNAGVDELRIAIAIARVAPKAGVTAADIFERTETAEKRLSLVEIFTEGRATRTILLWTSYFASLLMIYFLMSWLPLVLNQAGLSISESIESSVYLNVGGMVGGIVLGRFIDKYNPFVVLAVSYLVAGGFIVSIGFLGSSVVLLMAAIFLAGLFVIGGQTAMNAAAAALYPSRMRSTGVGMALAVGRMGSIVGPVAGGLLLDAQWQGMALFSVAAVPALIAVLAMIVLHRSSARVVEKQASV